MKNKIILVILIIIVVLIALSVLVFANVNTNTDENIMNRVFNEENMVKIDEAYIEKDVNMIKGMLINNKEEALIVANDYLTKLNLSGSIKNIYVKYFDNIIDSKKEVVITNNESIITLNAETKELISYINQKTSFPKNQLSKEQIRDRAIKLFDNLGTYNINDYKLIYLEQFDDEIWRVGFAKKYDDLINIGEQIRFSFAPQSNEILTLGISNIKYDNNEIKISEKEAIGIAKSYLAKSVATDMKVYVDIVRPNGFLINNFRENEIYVELQQMRKVYVCEFNNEDKTKIYIDCTTGTVLGGDKILGGEF